MLDEKKRSPEIGAEFLPVPRFLLRHGAPALAIAGAGIAAIGTYYASSIITLVGALVAAFSAGWLSVTQNELSERLELANQALREKAEEIASLVTGGDGFAYIRVEPNLMLGFLINDTKYPLYNINLSLISLPLKLLHNGDIFSNRVQTHVSDIGPNCGNLIPTMRFPKSDQMDFNIQFSARNGFWSQLLRIREVDGELRHAIRVVRIGPGNTIYEKVDAGFPCNDRGEVDWGE